MASEEKKGVFDQESENSNHKSMHAVIAVQRMTVAGKDICYVFLQLKRGYQIIKQSVGFISKLSCDCQYSM